MLDVTSSASVVCASSPTVRILRRHGDASQRLTHAAACPHRYLIVVTQSILTPLHLHPTLSRTRPGIRITMHDCAHALVCRVAHAHSTGARVHTGGGQGAWSDADAQEYTCNAERCSGLRARVGDGMCVPKHFLLCACQSHTRILEHGGRRKLTSTAVFGRMHARARARAHTHGCTCTAVSIREAPLGSRTWLPSLTRNL